MLERFGAVQVVSFSRFVRDTMVATSRIEAENAPTNAAFHALRFAGVNVSLPGMDIVEGVNLGNLEVVPIN
eukprot:9480467-Pyramimonas_sp.AAC.1